MSTPRLRCACALVAGLIAACGDGDGRQAGLDDARVHDAMDGGEAADEGLDRDDATGTVHDLDAASDLPSIDASAAFTDWLADSGIPWSAWLGEAGAAQPSSAALPALEAGVTRALVGRAYAESAYELKQPAALAAAFSAATRLTGDTRLFVTSFQESDAGVEVLYGAADRIDGSLIWQKPPARPRRFDVGAGPAGALVSEPFTYVLEARLAGARVYRLYLEAERSIWTATLSPDHESLAAELRGAVTRTQLEHRPLDVLSCTAACGQNSVGFCNTGATPALSAVLDCTGSEPDLDLDGDGKNDAYRLRLEVRSAEVDAPRE